MFSMKDWFLVDMGSFVEIRGICVKHEYFAEGDSIASAPIKSFMLDTKNRSIIFTTDCKTEYILRFDEIALEKALQTMTILVILDRGGKGNVRNEKLAIRLLG